ncbi:MAG: AraC family transcriptional regulator [Clostridia bacterium]|nr:AraC family transcriptional regulator [Clostridia bacterium]
MEQIQIKAVLDYIEENLKDELDNKKLARLSGYSEYHFIRLFRKYVCLTPSAYIRKRRISEIVLRIGEENRPISDIAFEYGFNSKENFTRAFKKEHHILPTEWKTAKCSLRLFMPFEFERIDPKPNVSMQYFESFSLIVYSFNGEFPPNCWNKYNVEKRSIKLSGGKVVEDFGAMIWGSKKGQLNYHIGVKSDDARGDTASTVQIEIKEGLYAVFETPLANQHNFVSTVRNTWDWIYREWLPNSGYHRADGYELESYVETGRKYIEKIYIPIEKE